LPKIAYDDVQDLDDVDDFQPIRRHTRQQAARPVYSPPERVTRREEFKCGHCKTFVGPPISGGRHRNHCPLCLHSKHVDRQQPGDRLSECRSLMAPAGTYFRRNGEQVIVHHCLGCDVERHCRVAADDHMISCMRLELVEPTHRENDRPDIPDEQSA
jgi:RNHCP domain